MPTWVVPHLLISFLISAASPNHILERERGREGGREGGRERKREKGKEDERDGRKGERKKRGREG